MSSLIIDVVIAVISISLCWKNLIAPSLIDILDFIHKRKNSRRAEQLENELKTVQSDNQSLRLELTEKVMENIELRSKRSISNEQESV